MFDSYVFDAYGTLFDVHSVTEKLEEKYPDKGDAISQEWRRRQVHYFMIRQLIDGYVPFDQITQNALKDALQINHANYHSEDIEKLMDAYLHLQPYEEVDNVKDHLPNNSLTIFSNGTPSMLHPLLENNQLEHTFRVLSADEPKVYKPAPAAYAYAQKQLKIADPENILFLSSNPWDITGAKSYGFTTAWVNRQQIQWPSLDVEPDHIFDNLNDLK